MTTQHRQATRVSSPLSNPGGAAAFPLRALSAQACAYVVEWQLPGRATEAEGTSGAGTQSSAAAGDSEPRNQRGADSLLGDFLYARAVGLESG